jgi:hypothetical protein
MKENAMNRDQDANMGPAKPISPALRLKKKHAATRYRLVSWFFARGAVSAAVATPVVFQTSPEAVWNRIMFYEEVPGRPPFLLRAFLPQPVRTEGAKTRTGAAVRCIYKRGDLTKRITAVDPMHYLQFEVIDQHLGIESCVLTLGGSYEISKRGDKTDVVLTTRYQAYLRPRYLWRPLEALLIRQLHRHILRGICAASFTENPAELHFSVESLPSRYTGDLACTASQSHFHR